MMGKGALRVEVVPTEHSTHVECVVMKSRVE